MSSARTQVLDLFDPIVADWFGQRFGKPTRVQAQCWPLISSGKHMLVTAETGSGKTLTAFLWAIDRLARATWPGEKIRVLYISPLRALNNDIQRNLLTPLAQIKQAFAKHNKSMPPIAVQTRSGDTAQSVRRRMLRHPPQILITTPESLNILLTSKTGQTLFDGLTTVILDEVHALAGSKRGTHLITAVERLGLLAGEFQRIALSATVDPKELVARWVAGWSRSEEDYRPRDITVVDASGKKDYHVRVQIPGFEMPTTTTQDPPTSQEPWTKVADAVVERIDLNRSTLVFGNSRRAVERLAHLINSQQGSSRVFSHHGSLSREIREVVEKRLKDGELSGIVATNSLELGIDVGSIDEVVLIQTPPNVTALVQRMGRAGHQVGQTSRARLFALFAGDLIQAAVSVNCALRGEVEPIVAPDAPLDVLAQIILSMVANAEWHLDELYQFLRCTHPYHHLSWEHFDMVVEMLAGRFAQSRIRSLRPRVFLDRISGTIRGHAYVSRLVYQSGGTIPDRGSFNLRLNHNRALIGSLDEEFVWERSIGDTFSLGVQSWRIQRVTHNDVLVTQVGKAESMTPFWRSEERDARFWFAERVGNFLEQANQGLGSDAFHRQLREQFCFDAHAADCLVDHLSKQKSATHCDLPHRHHVLLEKINDPLGQGENDLIVMHTTWGGRVNRPWSLALAQAWREKYNSELSVEHDDLCLVVGQSNPINPQELLDMVSATNLVDLVGAQLTQTGFYGAAFREACGRALLLPRAGFVRRTPLWLNRLRSKELLEAVGARHNFPLTFETMRTCLQDRMDLEACQQLLGELADGEIDVSVITTSAPSPFAASVIVKRTNELMYADDASAQPTQQASNRLLSQIVHNPQLRPRVCPALVAQLRQKLQRTYPDYSPGPGPELIDWVKERLLIPEEDWHQLLGAIERDQQLTQEEVLATIDQRVVGIRIGSGATKAVCAIENLPMIVEALQLGQAYQLESIALEGLGLPQNARRLVDRQLAQVGESQTISLAGFLAQWLRFEGPLALDKLYGFFGLGAEQNEVRADLDACLGELVESQEVIIDELVEGSCDKQVCDAVNLERLLRMVRKSARPEFRALPLAQLSLLLAELHNLGGANDKSSFTDRLQELLFYPAEVDSWETEIFPARIDYQPEWLDELFADGGLAWFAAKKNTLTFALPSDLGLVSGWLKQADEQVDETLDWLPQGPFRFAYSDLLSQSKLSVGELEKELWRLVWLGRISNDGFRVVRQRQVRSTPSAPRSNGPTQKTSRGIRRRIKGMQVAPGNWYRLPPAGPQTDLLEEAQIEKDLVRQLLDRYGVLFRQLLVRELPALGWRTLSRTLQIMELAGEVVCGHFFEGIDGLQFASPGVLRRLTAGLDHSRIYWVWAKDPASLCGMDKRKSLPARRASTHLVYHGAQLVLVSRRSGRNLSIQVEPDHIDLTRYLDFLNHLLCRRVNPRKRIIVEKINAASASQSPYLPCLRDMFATEIVDEGFALFRRY